MSQVHPEIALPQPAEAVMKRPPTQPRQTSSQPKQPTALKLDGPVRRINDIASLTTVNVPALIIAAPGVIIDLDQLLKRNSRETVAAQVLDFGRRVFREQRRTGRLHEFTLVLGGKTGTLSDQQKEDLRNVGFSVIPDEITDVLIDRYNRAADDTWTVHLR